MKIKAMSDNVIVLLDKEPTHIGKIALPDNVKNEPTVVTGVVVDVGPGREEVIRRLDNMAEVVLLKPTVKIGARVCANIYNTRSRMPDSEGRELAAIRWYDILAQIEE